MFGQQTQGDRFIRMMGFLLRRAKSFCHKPILADLDYLSILYVLLVRRVYELVRKQRGL
jgi:hypothetical protein